MIGNGPVGFGRGSSGKGPARWHLARRPTSLEALSVEGLATHGGPESCVDDP